MARKEKGCTTGRGARMAWEGCANGHFLRRTDEPAREDHEELANVMKLSSNNEPSSEYVTIFSLKINKRENDS